MENNLHSIDNEIVISKDENHVVIEFVIPVESDFFNGHFPEYKLLPAVAQIDLTTRFANKYFNTPRYITHIKRAKFSNPIRPDTKIRLEMTFKTDKQIISFTMSDAAKEDKVYCTGSFSTKKLEEK